MGKRLFAVTAALGLLIGLIAGVVGVGSAAAETPPGSQSDLIFFPWVPNGETLNTSNPWYGSIVIQNLESVPINLELGPTAGGVFPISAIVQPHAAYTFSAADLATQLGWSGDGGGVAAAATWLTSNLPSTICQSETGSIVVTRDDDVANLPAGMTKTADQDVLAGLPLGATITSITDGGATYQKGSDWTQSGNEITWVGNSPAENDQYTVEYTVPACTRGPLIGGVEKQAAPTNTGFAVSTDSSMTSVDGYTAIPDTDVAWGVSSKFCQQANPSGVCNNLGSYFLGWPVGGFDGTSYLPIVQGNYSGWNTYLHVTNIDASTVGASQVTITYYSQGQGVGNQGSFVDQFTLAAGQSKTINLANKAPKGFVGSAWISSQNGIVVSASRVKGSMALTNTNVPSLFATTSPDNGTKDRGSLGVDASCTAIDGTMCQMYAPLVYLDYNGWNTGFNIVNTSEFENQVTINVVNRDGTSVGVFTAAIPPKGMQYVYIPASQDQGLGQGSFTAAILTANAPFNATVDEVKYSTGEAMSYNATATLAVASGHGFDSRFFGNSLSLPLYQAGRVSNGVSHGDTSGINLFNPTGDTVHGVVNFYMSTGAAAGSTQIGGGTPFTLGAMSSALVAYAPSQANITPGSQLSAVVTVTGGKGGVVGVSNEVNYDVNGDGGLVFNMLNLDGQYRYPCSQTSCGSPVPPVSKFASKLTLAPAAQWVPHDPIMATVTATAYDANGNPMANVPVTFTVSGPNAGTAHPSSAVIKTDANGQAAFEYYNTTAGTDTVTATTPAPNGQTLASVPTSVKVHWTNPTLTVSPGSQTVYLSDNGGTPSPSYTWSWDFEVTGFSNCQQIPAIDWTVGGNNPQRFGPPNGYSGLTWTKSGNDTCTASASYISPNPGALAGKTKTYNWSLATDTPTAGNTTTLTWVAPTLSVTVCTVTPTGCFAEPGDGTPTNTTTVTADANHQGSWKYTFTVTGVPASDLNSARLHYTPVSPGTFGSAGSYTLANLDGSGWSCGAGTCTATASNSFNVSGRIGESEVLDWYLDLNGNGTKGGVDPTSSDNPTTVNYVKFAALVEVQNPTDTSKTNPEGFASSINATTDWTTNGVLSSSNTFNEVYQFTYSDPTITSCSALNTTATVTGTANSFDTTGLGGDSGSLVTWTGTAPTCTGTEAYNDILLSSRSGLVRSEKWSITNGSTTAADGTTTVNYPAPTFAVSVASSTTTPPNWFSETGLPQSVTTSPNATVVAYPQTLTDTSKWLGNWTWTFTTTNVSCADLTSGTYLVHYSAATGSNTPGNLAANQLTWTAGNGSTCTATLSTPGFDVTNLLGTDSQTTWSLIKASDSTTFASGNTTKLHFVGLKAELAGETSPGNFSAFGQTATTQVVDGKTSRIAKFTAYGFTADQLKNALVQWHYFPVNNFLYLGAPQGSYGPAGSGATLTNLTSWNCTASTATKQQCTATAETDDVAVALEPGNSIVVNSDWYLDLNADGNRQDATEPIGDQTQMTIQRPPIT